LLAGSGLTAARGSRGAFIVREAEASASQTGEAEAAGAAAGIESADQNLVVTGTRVRGAPVSSPVITITSEQMRASGHNNLGEVFRALPQSFNGGQNPGVGIGANQGGDANQNVAGASSLNLRGLGPDATLTLLNGARLPYDGGFQATDAAVIPIPAIDRVEILLDGASAIYGSDAIAGVANIILRHDYEGAELTGRYGGATDGGYRQTQLTGVAGATWRAGGFLVAADYSRNTAIRARDRDYLAYLPNQDITIYPLWRQAGTLFTGHQSVGSFAELALDAFYTDRHQEALDQSTFISRREADAEIWGISPSVRLFLPGDWYLRLFGFIGSDDSTPRFTFFSLPDNIQTGGQFGCACNNTRSAGAEAEGPLFRLPGGQARLSFGGGYRRNSFRDRDLLNDVTNVDATDQSYYVYTELNLPIIGPDQHIPLLDRLTLNAAARHEEYDSFGGTTTPKLGVIWSLIPGIDVRATWGRSFKAPTLLQQFSSTTTIVFEGFFFPGAPAGSTVMLVQGGNPNLRPERAETFTVGLSARPRFLPNVQLEANWFSIDYRQRVVLPLQPIITALINPAVADFVTFNPTAADQQTVIEGSDVFLDFAAGGYDPAKVFAILDGRQINAAIQKTSGVDVSIRFTTPFLGGQLTTDANATWIDSDRRLSRLSPEAPAAGVVFFPPRFRARIGAAWQSPRLTLASYVNHIGGVENSFAATNRDGDPMTTVDLVADYRLNSTPFGDLRFNLSISNLFNERPPFLEPQVPYFLNYDSTNYSPIGRTLSASVTARFR
jgi:iron complex outermembrane recepter protein